MRKSLRVAPALAACVAPWALIAPALASESPSDFTPSAGVELFGAPLEFYLFGATLIGVALLHHRTFTVAFTGLATIIGYKVFVTGFKFGPGVDGLIGHLWHERVILSNLFLLLIGFAVLSRHFEDSKAPEAMPRILPDNWTGGLTLLAMVFVLSSFLDNIAAALIGGVVARHVFKSVHIGYLAAIVASSNAGGSGSVVGDTTTTMMWIDGVSPLDVLHAYVAAIVAFAVFAVPLSIVQQRHSPIQKHREGDFKVDWTRVGVVGFILVSAIGANVWANLFAPHLLNEYPVIGLGVWAAIVVATVVRAPAVSVIPANFKGTLFLLALVTCASLMPVEKLPPAGWETALTLGFISSVFDNIPLTALALKQGGYDWGVLAYAVGFGGSMLWFGSSAGVALSNQYPEAKSAVRWVLNGWWVALGYVVGFLALMTVLGWHPHTPHKATGDEPSSHSAVAAPLNRAG
jgi:Na+/H+ antiporter NhaD/arsenite permease-like protein